MVLIKSVKQIKLLLCTGLLLLNVVKCYVCLNM